MNKTQFDLIAAKLIRREEQRDAVKLFMFNDAISAYAVEVQYYGKAVMTISRDAGRITEYFNECVKIAGAK